MSDGKSRTCDALGPEVEALLRGEVSPAEEAPVRAHLASCAPCAAYAADSRRVRVAAAALPSPAPSAAGRARLAAALDAAWEALEAEEAARGPVLRLLDAAGRRYAESRGVRFLTYSVAAHAAAALFLAVYLQVAPLSGGSTPPAPRGPLEVSSVPGLPPVYPDDPLAPPVPRLPGPDRPAALPGPAPALPAGDPFLGHVEPAPLLQDPVDFTAALRLYPTPEFSAWATGRFRQDLRGRRLARVFGEGEAELVASSVERGLRFLAATQEPDGTWASGRSGDPRPQRDRFRGGVTGETLRAFLGDGRTALRPGPYAATVRAAVSALARSQDGRTGLLGAFLRGPADDRPLCNHGPALAALAEAFGLDFGFLPAATRAELGGVIERALAATLAAQLPDGSFGYAGRGARAGDTSVTLLQLEALEAARRAGFAVDPAALERAGRYLLERVGPDGRLGYRTAGDRSSDATLTATALALGGDLGLPEEVRGRMLAAVLEEGRAGDLGHRVLFRSGLLEVLAAAGTEGRDLAPAAARGVLRAQGLSGAFPAGGDPYARAAGDVLATARTVRGLTAPYRSPAP